MNEILCKLYLELAHIVPPGTYSHKELMYREAMERALWYLNDATPKTRNGPTYRAADTLRLALGWPPCKIGGKFIE